VVLAFLGAGAIGNNTASMRPAGSLETPGILDRAVTIKGSCSTSIGTS
jgi:hypothetical protein